MLNVVIEISADVGGFEQRLVAPLAPLAAAELMSHLAQLMRGCAATPAADAGDVYAEDLAARPVW
jgi:hypothetical protein